MISDTTRVFLFIVGCIGTRLLFTYAAKEIDVAYLPYLGYLALIPAMGMLYIYLSGSREYGMEAGGKIWWNHLRPLHSLVLFLFAYTAIRQHKSIAWKFLLLDVIIGFLAFVNHRFLQ